MLIITIGMLLGSVAVLLLTDLPHFILSASILLLAAYFLVYFKNRQRKIARFTLAMLVGFSLTASVANYYQSHRFQASFEGKDLLVEGQVDSLVKINEFSRSFLFKVNAARTLEDERPLNWRGVIRLSNYRSKPRIKAGERWQLQVRLKRGSGFMNPAGFDYEKWLFAQRIEATGYLRESDQHQRLAAAPWYTINPLRERILNKIHTAMDSEANRALVSALMLAEKSEVSKQQWEVLRATGTSHLMAISGLHIGLVASGGLLIAWLIWWCFPSLGLYVPHRVAGSVMGVMLAVLYALLAGMTIPTQRALTMVVLGLLILTTKQHFSGYRILALAMIVVLLIDPLAVMNAGFYLSFAAVLLILWILKRVVKAGRFNILSIQGFLSLLMFPLSLLFFGQGSLISPVANIIAIPWVSFIIVPLSMVSVLLSFIGDSIAAYLFQFLSLHLNALFALLSYLADIPNASVEALHLSPLLISALLIIGLVILAPVGLAWRYVAGVSLLPLFFLKTAEPLKAGNFQLTVLDVGQGLAAVIETQHHSLVYDTGNRAGKSFDTGEMVVVPYLKQRALTALDALVISHDDRDHMGGLGAVLSAMEVKKFYGNRPQLTEVQENSVCEVGQHWEWDGVAFEFLHPTKDWQANDNNRSCVLKVSSSEHSVLLTGDIQRKAEMYLLKQNEVKEGSILSADVLLMPHHGSNSSSQKRFIEAVNPTWAIASAGYRSRFRHPDRRVIKRYKQQGVTVMNTADSGAVQFLFEQGKRSPQPRQYRLVQSKFWSR